MPLPGVGGGSDGSRRAPGVLIAGLLVLAAFLLVRRR